MKQEWVGLEELMTNLNIEIAKIKDKTMKGYIEVAILLRRSSELDTPTVPVDWGNLHNSFFTTTGKAEGSGTFEGPKAGEISSQHSSVKAKYKAEAKESAEPLMILGFSANYATFVHENKEAKFKRPGSGAGFLRTSIDENKQKILSLIRENAKIR